MISKLTRERLEKIKSWRETYGAGSNVMLPTEEAEELARMALAAMDSEPFAYIIQDKYERERGVEGHLSRSHVSKYVSQEDINEHEITCTPLYRHAQPAPVGNEFIPKNLDRALGVLGMALPESKEEFNLQSERWIQRLIDRVIRYADEFKVQPAPVVPESISVRQAISALESADAVTTIGQAYKLGWNACRAAMLNGGES